jgi:hypothetical protein
MIFGVIVDMLRGDAVGGEELLLLSGEKRIGATHPLGVKRDGFFVHSLELMRESEMFHETEELTANFEMSAGQINLCWDGAIGGFWRRGSN